jgi:2-polyprenyl-6-methoxyphenol hydroxylase-like FAD-dependent oxidoreductase
MAFDFDGRDVLVADFATLDLANPFVAMMPQWDFLDFIADRARGRPGFALRMRTEAAGLIEEGGRIAGLRAEGPDGPLEIRAALTVAADGRDSVLRDAAAMPVADLGAPIDVMWFRLPRRDGDSAQSLGRRRNGNIFILLNRGDYWQCAYVVPKGGAEAIRDAGLPAFRAMVDRSLDFAPPRAGVLQDWDRVKLLSVQVNRLKRWWREGLLFIGDAAHAMSPIGGVGINLAIQDAVAAANLLAGPLAAGRLTGADLAAVERRRSRAVALTQRFQVVAQNRVIRPAMRAGAGVPLPLRLIGAWPWLARFPARFIGKGLRMERVDPAIVAGRAPA